MTLVVFTDCDSCMNPISTNPGFMKAGEHVQARGAPFVAVWFEVVAVAGLMWVSRCVVGGAGFFLVFQVTTFFSNSCTSTRLLAARDPDSSQRRLDEGAVAVSQSAPRTRAHLSPPGVPVSVLAPETYGVSSVDQ